jgi:hypothetical protein
MSAGTAVMAGCAAVAAGLGLTWLGRRPAPSRRRHRCADCITESALAPWKRRLLALTRPGPGWAPRVRYGLRPDEYGERIRSGMAMNHPDWLTGVLPGDREELLAGLDAELEDM